MKTIQIPRSFNPDKLGIIASALCLVHCMATPVLFLAKACSTTCCADAPIWWQFIDYMFIVISFIAIYFATQNSSKSWLQMALWGSWAVLLVTILSETVNLNLLPAHFVYFPALSIVVLHFYNQRYCSCSENQCCK